jgi:O-methyltransferase
LLDQLHAMRMRYLDLVEATLTGVIYEDDPMPASGAPGYDPNLRQHGWDWPSKAFTMIGTKRLQNFRSMIESVIGENVPGDIVETGVWRGGACILARAVLATYGVTDRRIILADSFAGLPVGDAERYPADADSNFHSFPELAVSVEQVKQNFQKFGLLDEQVVFVEGWFDDTMATLDVEEIAVLRLDGDMYGSTIVVLNQLYDKVAVGGWIIIDDYEVVPACKAAVTDFFAMRNLSPEFSPIDGVGVYFRKLAN